jgi:type VI secretion system protein VasG
VSAVTNTRATLGKLNPVCRRALEAAAGLCVSNTHYNIEVEHWLLKLLEPTESDIPKIFRHYEVDLTRVVRELTRALDAMKRGSAQRPAMSGELGEWMTDAWSLASLEYAEGLIRTSHLLCALMTNRTFGARVRAASPELARIPADKFQKDLEVLTHGSPEDLYKATPAVAQGAASKPVGQLGPTQTPSLDQYTQDLTARAKKKELDPVVGRDREIRQVIDILTRRRQNNPILTGEAGVGKTAIVEGLALRIADKDVPESLQNAVIRTLDLALLQAGAGVKGEFENRLKTVIAEVKASPFPIILFIDEAHTMIGAGAQAGGGDAANLLKPALARGELRTIAATTWAEYKKYFEGDAALKRRFQVVRVAEPDLAPAMQMMRGLTESLEKHHNVRIMDEAVESSVLLSARYVTERQLPDKSVSLLDTACARVALSQAATPAPLEDCRRDVQHYDVEIGILKREMASGGAHARRLDELTRAKREAADRLTALEKRLEDERKLVSQIRELRKRLERSAAGAEGSADRLLPDEEQRLRTELSDRTKDLKEKQGDTPLVMPVVDAQAVADVVSNWTGIPVGKMVTNEIRTLLALKEQLMERVVGQDHAMEAVARRIQTARAQLADPRKPLGVFLLVGPSGVGKTETALVLADILYGGDRNVITINMSEYQDDSKISNLIGSAKGLVGYGEGGVLTEAVRRKPHSIVLLDEVEKAHVGVQEMFYQVFDKGMLMDSSGNDVNFKNTIILLTSNAGTDVIAKHCEDPLTRPDPAGLYDVLRPELLKIFKPAFLGRLTIVPYFPLADEVMRQIIRLKLGHIRKRMKESHKARFEYDDAVVDTVAGRCKEVESGARNVDNILTGTLLPELSRELLSRLADGKTISAVKVGVGGDGAFTYELS